MMPSRTPFYPSISTENIVAWRRCDHRATLPLGHGQHRKERRRLVLGAGNISCRHCTRPETDDARPGAHEGTVRVISYAIYAGRQYMYTPAHTHTHATGLHTPLTNHSWPNFNPAERLNGTRQAHVPSEDRHEADRPTVFGATHHCRCDVM